MHAPLFSPSPAANVYAKQSQRPSSSPESAQPLQAPLFVGPVAQPQAYPTEDEHQSPLVAPTWTQGPPTQATKTQVIEQSAQPPVRVHETPVPAVPWTSRQSPVPAPVVAQSTLSPSRTAPDSQPGPAGVWSNPDYHDIYQSSPASTDDAYQHYSVTEVKPGTLLASENDDYFLFKV